MAIGGHRTRVSFLRPPHARIKSGFQTPKYHWPSWTARFVSGETSGRAKKQDFGNLPGKREIKRKCQSRMGNQSAECGKWGNTFREIPRWRLQLAKFFRLNLPIARRRAIPAHTHPLSKWLASLLLSPARSPPSRRPRSRYVLSRSRVPPARLPGAKVAVGERHLDVLLGSVAAARRFRRLRRPTRWSTTYASPRNFSVTILLSFLTTRAAVCHARAPRPSLDRLPLPRNSRQLDAIAQPPKTGNSPSLPYPYLYRSPRPSPCPP